jgi:membrane-bound metal-dependent hydrolase YbcI (DUF457 family)
MWPWEHLAFGYLLYSLSVRSWRRRPPVTLGVLTLVFATQFPDLVDKPLAWVFHVLPSGLSLAHSLLFAVPATVLVLLVAWWRNVSHVGFAFAIGYFSHLLGDVLYPYLLGRDLIPRFLLWPLVERQATVDSALLQVFELWGAFVAFLGTPRGKLYFVFEVALLTSVLLLWLFDGHPGLPSLRRRSATH